MVTEKVSGKRARCIVAALIRRIPALILGIATTACAHTSSGTPPSPSKEPAPMSATDTFRPYTLAEYPELTPEEMGRRFLKLIDDLKSFDELSLERLQEVMRLRLIPLPESHGGSFTMHLPESSWYYGLSYYNNPQLSENKNATYHFINDKDRQGAEMTPVCGMDFNAYVSELKQFGFVEREDLAQYDSPMPPPIYNAEGQQVGLAERRFFRLPGYHFSRGDVGVVIRERREADMPDQKLHHACVESIRVGKGG